MTSRLASAVRAIGRTSIGRAVTTFFSRNRTDNAAGLTYYSVLSLFPALIVGVSVIGMLDPGATGRFLANFNDVLPESVLSLLDKVVGNLQSNRQAAGAVALLGTLTSLWAAGNYIAAFGRAGDLVTGTDTGRAWWKTLLVRLGLTAGCGLLAIVGVITVTSGSSVASTVGGLWGQPDATAALWGWLRWLVLAAVIITITVVLYRYAPSRNLAARELIPGALLGMVLAVAASAAFGMYVSSVADYDATYGSLAGVIIFLVWLWLLNTVLLLGFQYGVTRGESAPANGGAEEEG
ncbi:YhjD/YihY/BrkB family envelope integrity protein [Haloglycomyces albus]|uniref:YihY/virulence factor BrkB family protein n=1 Tax=Haloglycomyces albus TaxID=526067 RepID=UPI00046D1775